MEQLDQLVDDDVVDLAEGSPDDPPVEAQDAAGIAGGSALLLAADQDAGGVEVEPGAPIRGPMGAPFRPRAAGTRLSGALADQARPGPLPGVPRRHAHSEPATLEAHVALSTSAGGEGGERLLKLLGHAPQ